MVYNAGMVNATDLILICLLRTPRDLEIARLLGWYRIPFRTSPKVVAVDHLAFYQPSSFNETGGQIIWVARVKGHELTTRAELLKDEPDHPRAREEYYKIQIDTLKRLDPPIRAEKWRRLTFLYTTGEYLLKARTLNDLVIRSDERQLLWKSLRERAHSLDLNQGELPEVEIPPEILSLLGLRETRHSYQQEDPEDDLCD